MHLIFLYTRNVMYRNTLMLMKPYLYSWYNLACSKNIYPTGPQLVVKAKEIAQRLRKTDFEVTPGWLSKWKARYNIRRMKVRGESGDVFGDCVRSWKERLTEILKGYKNEDIYNLDESGCFWWALPDSGFGEREKMQRWEKKQAKIYHSLYGKGFRYKGKANCNLEE